MVTVFILVGWKLIRVDFHKDSVELIVDDYYALVLDAIPKNKS